MKIKAFSNLVFFLTLLLLVACGEASNPSAASAEGGDIIRNGDSGQFGNPDIDRPSDEFSIFPLEPKTDEQFRRFRMRGPQEFAI